MKTYKTHTTSLSAALLLGFFLPFSLIADEIAQVSGTASLKVPAGTVAVPSYQVASVGVSGQAAYAGTVASVSGNVLTFETSSDSEGNAINPFTPSALAAGVAHLKATRTGDKITAVTDLGGAPISGTNTESSGLDDANPPTILIGDPDSGEDVAVATATVSGGKITGVSIAVADQGSGYTSDPAVTVNCGPHIIRLTAAGSSNQGRSFLITANTATTVTLSNPNSENLATIFTSDSTVEIIRAQTLGEVFGTETALVASGNAYSADFVYLWDPASRYYAPYYHNPGGGFRSKGWYNQVVLSFTPSNDTVVWPDEAFIIARRTNSELVINMDGEVLSTDQKMQLPASGGQFVMNNPFGADILLSELISPANVGGANDKFKPGTTANDGADGDNIYLLAGNAWTKYWYEDGINDGVTSVATASVKTPAGGVMTTADVSLASGTVTGLTSWDLANNGEANGLAGRLDHNESEYTKVSISGSAPATGFTITFSDVRGRKINDNGDMELDEDGVEVSNGSGSDVESIISGSFNVEATGSGYVVVKKRRNVNFVSAGSSPAWSTGDGGGGYAQNAVAYFIGGNNGTTDANATGTASVSGGKVTGITVTAGGSGYTSAPQVVIAPGGWRKEGAAGAVQDGAVIAGSGGILIIRNHPTGTLTYLDAENPLN